MTAAEQYIYNCYLETSRKLNNKPFKYRKDFEGFEEKEEYILVSKLSRFFAKYSNINIKDFFEAPYFVYNEKYSELVVLYSSGVWRRVCLRGKHFILINLDKYYRFY